MNDLKIEVKSITILSAAAVSDMFRPERWAYFYKLLTPAALTDADFTLQATIDGGSTWLDVVDFATQADALLLTAGAVQSKMVDFGDLVRGFAAENEANPDDNNYFLRLKSSVNQGANRVFQISMQGG